ncbi:MAG TPA: 4-hydroxyphenylpyruvate dioxygenase, partial [Acidimicrobiales bacterium]|nr:4-hydroxyphenylpyruvate dioxygenase [Acidimicrobiales bacterium]
MSTTVSTDTAARAPAARLLGWDCLELWVGNARTTAGFLMSAFGFTCTAYAGPETGVRHKASYVLEQGDIRLVVSAALAADSPIAEHVRTHGDGVHDLAWLVDDAAAAFEAAVARGAHSVREPWTESDEDGALVLAQIGTYGETVHTFVERGRYPGSRLEPGYGTDNLPPTPVGPDVALAAIDHVVGNVELGRLDDWVRFYSETMGFEPMRHFSEDQISTEYSALASTVVWDGKQIVMPINEPALGRGKSQIQEYLEAYDGPGVQHIALRTDDIVGTVDALRRRGVRFMQVPDTYYDEAKVRLHGVDLPWDDLER